MLRTRPLTRLLWPLCVALLILPFGVTPPARPAVAAAISSAPEVAANTLAAVSESEPNDTTTQAQAVGALLGTWSEQVTGKISTSTDIDYYTFTLLQPASSVKITLTNLPADYDLVLAADADTGIQQGSSGLDDVPSIGGTLSSIGGTLSSIGGTLSSIGGTLSSIGGTLSSIGGTLSSISANSGTADEEIDTYLWQPGTYYIAVGSSNGAYNDVSSYTLNIQVSGSGMAKPAQAAPEVEMQVAPTTYNGASPITTLYLTYNSRMSALYPNVIQSTAINTITNRLNSLAFSPPHFPNTTGGVPEYGYVIDLANLRLTSGPQTVPQIYAEWDSNRSNPLYANKVARLIDNVIKAATDPARKGKSCPPSQTICNTGMNYGGAGANNAAPFPNVKYIVLVGGDNILPFFRVPDLTTLANESDYAAYLKSIDSAGIIEASNPQGAALKSRMLLTDNPYGTDKPLRFQGFPLFLPNRAVGRLVETPEEIAHYLDKWGYENTNNLKNYVIDARSIDLPASAFVTGYDFLRDEGDAISRTLKAGLAGTLFPANITGLINDSWTRSDLESSWFGSDLTASVVAQSPTGIFSDTVKNDPLRSHRNRLFSLNSHFDHWRILPAVGSSSVGGTFPAQRLLDPSYQPDPLNPGGYFYGTLGYSVGCHSGYNVLDGGIILANANASPALYKADFAQAFITQAGNWIGNTGYGYGSADGIDYSERLALLLTQELVRDVRDTINGTPTYVGSSIGISLAHAKQRYLRNSATLSAYDAKALTIMTLYGLPFIHVLTSSPLAPPPEEPRIGPGASVVPTESKAPLQPVNNFGRLERTITVTVGLQPGNYVPLPRTGSKELQLTDRNFTVTDSFVDFPGSTFPKPTLRVFDNHQAGVPSLPTFAYDISALNSTGGSRLQVRDVVFMEGEYAPTMGFNPQITQIVTETDSPIIKTSQEPTFAAGAGIWYPDKFFGFSSVGTGDDQRDQLTATAAQFKADANGVTGQLRGYTKMVFKVYYTDPNGTGGGAGQADTSAPTITSVQIGKLATANTLAATTSGVTVVATVSDSSGGTGVDSVHGVYVLNGTTWTPVNFTQPNQAGDPERWEAFIPLQPGALRVIVSAADKAGNVSYYTAKGTFSFGARLFLPLTLR